MSDSYNPESTIYEQLEALTVEARALKHEHDRARTQADRETIARQLQEVERRIERLKHRWRG